MNYYVSNRRKATVYFRDYNVLSEERRTEIESVGHHYREFITQVLRQGQGGWNAEAHISPTVAAIVLIEAINSISRWYDPEGQGEAERDDRSLGVHDRRWAERPQQLTTSNKRSIVQPGHAS